MKQVKTSIAIIVKSEAEWFYFDSLRRSRRHSFFIEPALPQDTGIDQMMNLVCKAINNQYDYVFCLTGMNSMNVKEYERYNSYVRDSRKIFVYFIENIPCIEFWFLLHFLEDFPAETYINCEAVMVDLKKYLNSYEKTKTFYRKNNLYELLSANGDLKNAKAHAVRLAGLHETKTDNIHVPHTDIYRILALLDELTGE